ncbi:MAG: InlB B-repeat-containing protein [Bacteroidales bacterium]
MKKHFQLLALVTLVISAIGFNSCRKEKNDDDANGGDTATSYTVTFDANGATGTAPTPMTAKKDEMVKLPTSEGMTAPADKPNFLGWDIDKAATTATFPAGLEITSEVDITLYAIWTAGSTATSYTVTFDANGATGTAPTPMTATEGASVTLPAQGTMTAPVDKHIFLGWSTNKDASEAELKAGADYLPTANVTLYAIWKYSFVKTIEAYMALSKDEFEAKMAIEGFHFITSDPQIKYEKTLTSGVVGCTVSYVTDTMRALYYYHRGTYSDNKEYIAEFEDWKTQAYALYENNFDGFIIDADTKYTNYTNQKEYETNFNSKKDDLKQTSISVESNETSCAVLLVIDPETFNSEEQEVYLDFYRN